MTLPPVANTEPSRARRWSGDAAALLGYSGFSILFFGRAVLGDLSSSYVGNGPDPQQSIWFLAWWSHALTAHLNPLYTRWLWAPAGANLAWTTNIPLAAILVLPITRALGPVAAYNILALACPALAGWAAFVLCRYIVRDFASALLGGFIFGFSPYVACKLLGNVDLALVPMLPLAVYLALCAMNGGLRRGSFVVLLAIVLSAQFLIFIEAFATLTMSAAIAIAIALLVADGVDRARVRALIAPIAMSYAIAALLLAPYLYYLFAFGFPHGAIWSTRTGSVDLLNFVVPVPTSWLGEFHAMRSVAADFRAGIYDADAYLGLTLVIAIATARRRWRETAVRMLVLFAAAIGVLATGSWLQVGGRFVAPMPWLLVSQLPLIAKAVPARLTVYLFLALAILSAMWMSEPRSRALMKSLGAGLLVISILPNLESSFWATKLNTPEFFAAGLYKKYIQPDQIAVVLPYGFEGEAMLWQALSGFHFRLAGGYTGFAPPIPDEYERWPIVDALYDVALLPQASGQFKAFLKRHDVSIVIFAGAGEHAIDVTHSGGPGIWRRGPIPARDREVWNALLDGLDVPAASVGGVTLYQFSAAMRSAWPDQDPVALQARSAAIRFDALVIAAYRYVASGRPLRELSPLVAQQADLLPMNWVGGPLVRSSQTPGLLLDGLMLGPAGRYRVAVGVQGSYAALKPLIDRYRPFATAINFPYPHPLTANQPQGDSPALMTIVFDVDQLARAAHLAMRSP